MRSPSQNSSFPTANVGEPNTPHGDRSLGRLVDGTTRFCRFNGFSKTLLVYTHRFLSNIKQDIHVTQAPPFQPNVHSNSAFASAGRCSRGCVYINC